jgi:hypothetical protein
MTLSKQYLWNSSTLRAQNKLRINVALNFHIVTNMEAMYLPPFFTRRKLKIILDNYKFSFICLRIYCTIHRHEKSIFQTYYIRTWRVRFCQLRIIITGRLVNTTTKQQLSQNERTSLTNRATIIALERDCNPYSSIWIILLRALCTLLSEFTAIAVP